MSGTQLTLRLLNSLRPNILPSDRMWGWQWPWVGRAAFPESLPPQSVAAGEAALPPARLCAERCALDHRRQRRFRAGRPAPHVVAAAAAAAVAAKSGTGSRDRECGADGLSRDCDAGSDSAAWEGDGGWGAGSSERSENIRPLVALVGAGPVGLKMALALQDMGIPYAHFERAGVGQVPILC